MIRSTACLVLVAGLASSTAFAADPPATASAPEAMVATDTFLTQTAGGNLFEIDSSKLALSKSNSDDVKSFATQMVIDHGMAGTKFKKAVSEAELRAPPERLDSQHAAVMKNLEAKSGTDFDKAYIDAQYQGHVATVALFESYAKSGADARIKQFAQELLPTLHDHLDHVRKLKSMTANPS